MLIILLIIAAVLVTGCGNINSDRNKSLENLYVSLDNKIDSASYYENLKQDKIERLKSSFNESRDLNEKHLIAKSLFDEYESFNADSALYYLNYLIKEKKRENDRESLIDLSIKKADIFAHAGLFSDALNILNDIKRSDLKDSQLENYYVTYSALYQYLGEYTNRHETALEYDHLRDIYSDSIALVTSSDSFNSYVYVESLKAREGNPQQGIEAISKILENYNSGSRNYSILTSILAYLYHINHNEEMYKKYLLLSAISDIEGAVKENMSFRELATVTFEEGDIERANKYLKKSIADANFYSALMRNAQSARMLPVIDNTYSEMQKDLNHRLRTLAWICSSLALVLLLTIIFIWKQFISLRRDNDRINNLNNELKQLTEEIQLSNERLSANNLIKEQYATLFMEYCSTAISTLDHYQNSVKTYLRQRSGSENTLKKINSSDIAAQLRTKFYEKFDEAILNIFPNFVEKFNSLLLPEQVVKLKANELMNTELRLYALIRLGIEDSADIAKFLQCSVSTVYTYRSKFKRRAIAPETFEDDIKKL